ncbi:MAG: hypothetical protein V1709_07595 [Planctomycetota bacterium]
MTEEENGKPPLDIRQFAGRVENWCALVLLIAFFLPWISILGITENGPAVVKELSESLGTKKRYETCSFCNGTGRGNLYPSCVGCNGTGQHKISNGTNLSILAYLAYFMAVLALLLVVNGLRGGKLVGKFTNQALLFVTGVIPVLLLIISLVKYGSEVFSIMAIGGWLTLLAGIFLIISAFADVRSWFAPKPTPGNV